MLENIDLEHIKNTKWYRQGGAGLPFYFFVPFTGGMSLWGKSKNVIIQQEGIMHHAYFNRATEWRVAMSNIKKQLRDRTYIDKMIEEWFKRKQKSEAFIVKFPAKKFKKLKINELLKCYQGFTTLDYRLWRLGAHIESFDPWAEKIIAEVVQKSALSLSAAEIALATAPAALTLSQQEELDLYNIALAKIRARDKLLIQHQKEYFWIKRDWAHISTLSVAYFKNKVSKLMVKGLTEVKATRNRILSEFEKRQEKRQSIIKKYEKDATLGRIFYFFSRMASWRDERKKAAMVFNGYYYKFAKEFSRRTGLPYVQIVFLTPTEVSESKLQFSAQFKKQLAARSRQSAYYADRKGKSVVLTGAGYRKFMRALAGAFGRQFKELKGQPVCQGKVVGLVKIVNLPADFKKFLKGNILVAPMTRPEYLPLIKIAAAIVTDEGGVTCHAAIISRELGIPCVIGTQVATEVLHDGDLVEVDANTGVVRKSS